MIFVGFGKSIGSLKLNIATIKCFKLTNTSKLKHTTVGYRLYLASYYIENQKSDVIKL